MKRPFFLSWISPVKPYSGVPAVGRTGQDQHTMTVCMRLGGYGSLSSGEAWFKDFSVTKLDGAPAGETQEF